MGARNLETLRDLNYMDMTREERVKLMLADSDAYMDKVPEGHWLDVLDGVAKIGPIEK